MPSHTSGRLPTRAACCRCWCRRSARPEYLRTVPDPQTCKFDERNDSLREAYIGGIVECTVSGASDCTTVVYSLLAVTITHEYTFTAVATHSATGGCLPPLRTITLSFGTSTSPNYRLTVGRLANYPPHSRVDCTQTLD